MNIADAKKVVSAAAKANDTVLMSGVHGIGKSQIVEQFAEEEDFHIETLFLSHQEVGDLIGMPRTKTVVIGTKMVKATDDQGNLLLKNGEPYEIEVEVTEELTTWTKPIWLQRMELAAENGKRIVLFLDELNRAPIDVRQSALQLVLERKIHEHALPEVDGFKCMVVAAINPSGDYQVDELDPALLDRFLSIEVEVDAPAWLSWAGKNGVNPIVRDFIRDNPKKLHWTPVADGSSSGNKNQANTEKLLIGATPRSWTKLSAFIDIIDTIPGEVHFPIIKGKIGAELAAQFITFMKNYVDIVKMEDIEELVIKAAEKTKNPVKLGKAVEQMIDKMEAIVVRDLIDAMSDKYIQEGKEKKPHDALPVMALLYAVKVELLNSYLKTLRNTDRTRYDVLVDIDDALNSRGLFLKVVEAIQE